MAGLLEDGSVWLLLSQAGDEDLKFILPRFEHLGLSAQVAQVPDRCVAPAEPAPEPAAQPEAKPAEPKSQKSPEAHPAKPPKTPPAGKPSARPAAARRAGSTRHKPRLDRILDSLLSGGRCAPRKTIDAQR